MLSAMIVALFSALLVALSFPTVINGVHFPNLSGLIWVSLVPLFLLLQGQSYRRAFVVIVTHSVFYNSLVSYWIIHALTIHGELPSLASLLILAAIGFLLGLMLSLPLLLARWAERRYAVPWTLTAPVAWLFAEYVRNYGPFGGYPWANLGYALSGHGPWLQSADLFGHYGLSFLIVFANVVLTELILALRRKRAVPCVALTMLVFLLGLGFGYGQFRGQQVRAGLAESEQISIGIVQPNIPQQIKWDPAYAGFSVEKLLRLTDQAFVQGAELVIWPESAYPDPLPVSLTELGELSGWSRPVLIGAVTLASDDVYAKDRILYNSVLLLEPGGFITGVSHKRHLVPLGEYIPLKNILGFLEAVAPALGDFRAGHSSELFSLHGKRYGATICYEDLFPELSREFVQNGANFLVNMTNDAWYGYSSQLWQHLEFSRFRAVEMRRSMVRATNTGLSAIIDPAGDLRQMLPPFAEGSAVTEVPLLSELTFYARFGEGPLFCLLGLALLVSIGLSHVRARSQTQNA